MENVRRLVIPIENLSKMMTALTNSGYWIKTETVFDGKILLVIREDEQ